MITRKVEVKTYMEHACCDCGGEFIHIPKDPCEPIADIAVWPPRKPTYPHKCNRCGEIKSFDQQYPVLKYEEIK